MSEATDLLVRLSALATPGQPEAGRRALVWLNGKGKEEREMTFTDVGAQASSIAKTLLLGKCGLSAGDKVLLVFLPGLDFIAAFVACLLAGCVAVPIYPPDPRNPAKGMAKLLAAVEVTEPKVALSHNEFLRGKRLQVLSGKGPKYPKGLAFHSVTPVLKKAVYAPELFQAASTRDPHRLAFIQFSSGSTNSPKAVAISMGNLNANLHSMERAFGGNKTSVAVSWTPFYHDMGLVAGVCHGLYIGAEHIAMSPMTFVRRPFTWLEAISKYGGTITNGVNFAYDILVSKVTDAQLATLDLRYCTRYSNAAEPVRASTLRAFVAKFGRCGVKMAYMDPSFGGAENVVFCSNRPGTKPREPLFLRLNGASLGMGAAIHVVDDDGKGDGAVVELVGNGEPGVTTEIVAVHPDKREALGSNVVGELWITGPSKALGYFREKGGVLDTSAFSATLEGQQETHYYRTGDLGFLYEGQVFVCGRLKDMLIINGQNVFPQDLEHAVSQASPLVRPGCVIVVGVESPTAGEAAVAIAEVRDASEAARSAWYEAAQAIKQRVIVKTGVKLEQVHFIRPRTIPKTTSGKVQRAEAKRKLLDGTLGSLFALGVTAAMPAATIELNDDDDDDDDDVASGWDMTTALAPLFAGLQSDPAKVRSIVKTLQLKPAYVESCAALRALLLAPQSLTDVVDGVLRGTERIEPFRRVARKLFLQHPTATPHFMELALELLHWVAVLDEVTQQAPEDVWLRATLARRANALPLGFLKSKAEAVVFGVSLSSLRHEHHAGLAVNIDMAAAHEAHVRKACGEAERSALRNSVVGAALAERTWTDLEAHKTRDFWDVYLPWNMRFLMTIMLETDAVQFVAPAAAALLLPKSVLLCDARLCVVKRVQSLALALMGISSARPGASASASWRSMLTTDVADALAKHTVAHAQGLGFRVDDVNVQSVRRLDYMLPVVAEVARNAQEAGAMVGRCREAREDAVGAGVFASASFKASAEAEARAPPPPLDSRAACVEWFCERAADVLGVDSCKADADVHELGVTSVGSVALVEALEELSAHTRKIEDFAAFFADNATPAQMVDALRALPASTAAAATRVEQSLPPLRHIKSRRLAPCTLALLQLLGISLVCALIFVAVLPSYHFVYWVLYTLDEPGLSRIRLWDNVHQYGVLVALAQPLFLLSLTVVVILLKWLVIGRYKAGTALDMNSVAFYRWWLVDRALYVWHSIVGYFIVSTPLANLFLIFMGADVAMSAKIGSIPGGEFDLFHVGKDAQLDGSLLARAFDAESRTLRLRGVRVGERAVVHVRALVLPGAIISSDTVVEPLTVVPEGGQTLAASVYAGNPAILQASEAPAAPPPPASTWHWSVELVQKLVVMLLTLYGFGAVSTVSVALWGLWGYPTNAATPLVYWASFPLLNGPCFLVLAVLFKRLLFRFVSRGPLARFAVDFQYKAVWLVFVRIFTTTRSVTLLLRAYGASAASTSFCASTNTFKASDMDNLVLEDYSFVTVGTFRGDGTGGRAETRVRAGVEVSLGAVVDSGADVYRRVGPNAHIKRASDVDVELGSTHPLKRTSTMAAEVVTDVEPTTFLWSVWEEAFAQLLRVVLYACFVLALVPAYAYAVWVLYGNALFWLPASERHPVVENRSLAIVLLFPSLLLATFGVSVVSAMLSRAVLPSDPASSKPRASLQCAVINTASVVEVLLIPLAHGTTFYNAHARLHGAKVGRGVFVNSLAFRDHAWQELGDGCVVDGAYIIGHQFSGGQMHNGRIRIGKGSTVHPGCLVFAGLGTNDAEVLAHGKLAIHARSVSVSESEPPEDGKLKLSYQELAEDPADPAGHLRTTSFVSHVQIQAL